MAFELNEEQQRAVETLRGLVIISAGAGSGKTRTLSERFARALAPNEKEQWQGTEPGRILTITFTEKAAGELAERVRSTLRTAGQRQASREVDSAWISTIHGFCSRILKRYALEAGLDPSFGVAETIEARRLEDRAFEHAAQAVLETADGEALFGDFEFADIYKAVLAATMEVRNRGLDAHALRIGHGREVGQIRQEALMVLRAAGERMGATGDQGKNTLAFCGRCEAALQALAGLELESLSSSEAAKAVWSPLAEVTMGRSNPKAKEEQAAIFDEVQRLTGDAATAAAAPYARALVALVEQYMDAYAEEKRERGLLDFDDLQAQTLRLFGERPDVLAECRALFELSMVDEFQDTDALQLALVKAVAGEHLCTVGDEHQSIYGFRGADISVFRDHEAAMVEAGARSCTLFENYRSHSAILGFVNELFSKPELFGPELVPLRHGRAEKEPRIAAGEPRVEVCVAHKPGRSEDAPRRDEARMVAERFARLRDERDFRGGEMVVLLRGYKHAEVYACALRARGFDVMVVGGSRFLTLPEVTTVRMLVRAIANQHDEVALVHLLSGDAGRVSDEGLLLMKRHRRRMAEALQNPPEGVSEHDRKRVEAVSAVLEAAGRRLGHVPLSEIVLRATEELGLDLVLLSRGDLGRQAYANVLKFARLAADFEGGMGAGPSAFTAYLDAREEYGEHTPPATLGDDESSSVRIMSIHAAKGLEFPAVAIAGMGSGSPGDTKIVRLGPAEDGEGLALAMRMPSNDAVRKHAERPQLFQNMEAQAKADEAQEGRRLFYVACTRAEEVLVLAGMANMEKGPSDSENMLNWLRTALPGLEAPIGAGPVACRVGEWGVSVEVSCSEGDDLSEEAEETGPGPWEPDLDVAAACGPAELPVPDRLSYTDLALFGECPKRFWAQRVLRAGTLSLATEGGSLRLGSALHAILQLSDAHLPPVERIRAISRHFRLSDDDAARVLTAAERFLSSEAAAALLAHATVRREWPFIVDVGAGDDRLWLKGSIDAYGRSGTQGMIVDYKSGTSGQGQELRERYALQARCYALVALEDGCTFVRVTFVRPDVPKDGGGCEQVEFDFDTTSIPDIAAEIRQAHERMERGEYASLARWDPQVCKGCPIQGSLCHARAPQAS